MANALVARIATREICFNTRDFSSIRQVFCSVCQCESRRFVCSAGSLVGPKTWNGERKAKSLLQTKVFQSAVCDVTVDRHKRLTAVGTFPLGRREPSLALPRWQVKGCPLRRWIRPERRSQISRLHFACIAIGVFCPHFNGVHVQLPSFLPSHQMETYAPSALPPKKKHGKGKGKFHPRTGHEGPEGEYRYSCTFSLSSALDGGGWTAPRLGRFTPPPQEEARYPLNGRLGGPRTGLVVWGKSVGAATISVTWLITLKGGGQNRPWASGTLIYEEVSRQKEGKIGLDPRLIDL